ncbi:MAG: hypothetical protein Q8P68_04405 [Candidatus Peregrinibacteria bacterium]|nr:hypothetical protein [Candidatus Peregrinibacteria bacterium]MDZ4245246.1 hypothetical protein [Candidatus Gracilibacteria bacterium]
MKNLTKLSDVEKLSDKELITLCQKYGTQTILWKRKFIGLLPEVNSRRLYERKGFSTIYEFAARTAGLSREQVQRAIHVERRFREEGLTDLRNIFVEGHSSVSKLFRVASVANAENESDFVKCISKLSQSALETLVRHEKEIQMKNLLGENSGGFCEGSLFGGAASGCGVVNEDGCLSHAVDLPHLPEHGEGIFVRTHKDDYATDANLGQAGDLGFEKKEVLITSENMADRELTCELGQVDLQTLQKLGLDKNVITRLNELKSKGFDLNEILEKMLNEREERLEEKLNTVGEEVVREEAIGKEVGRNIPAKVKRVISARAGTKCEVRGCMRDAKNTHHTIRFGLSRSHDPRHLVQLCKEHHELTHVLDEKYLEKRRL